MDDKLKAALQEALERHIPKTLDDIIRCHRDRFSVGLASEADLDALAQDVGVGPARDAIDRWNFIRFDERPPEGPAVVSVHLLGWARQQRVYWITSRVVALDRGRTLVRTRSGSRYDLGMPGEGEPNINFRLHVCRALHAWGFGKALGVIEVF